MLEALKPGYLKYKAGTFLTDGRGVIYIRYVSAPSWTPMNNYGTKDFHYSVKIWPVNYTIRYIMLERFKDKMAASWFRHNHPDRFDDLLGHFRPINPELLSEKIVSQLKR